MRTVRADQISEMRSIVRKQKASNRPSTGTRPRTPVAGQKSGGLCRSALPADTRLCAAAQKSRFPSFADTRYHAAGRPASHRGQRADVLRAENLRTDRIWQSSRVVVGDRDCKCGQCLAGDPADQGTGLRHRGVHVHELGGEHRCRRHVPDHAEYRGSRNHVPDLCGTERRFHCPRFLLCTGNTRCAARTDRAEPR